MTDNVTEGPRLPEKRNIASPQQQITDHLSIMGISYEIPIVTGDGKRLGFRANFIAVHGTEHFLGYTTEVSNNAA